ncbi:YadA C-terminal domain-containing protein [Pasteurella multocida]|uniref:YadA C-terminal domain-containing protein n=1 Tax=Pasteurella multocida TaxID=747 RepID=UPI0024469776|nr:YadA C-terminal domain-containing protein [Pasteurella multocida]
MNLSKIAAGVAVSLCLVSNVVIAKNYNLSLEEKAEKKLEEYSELSNYLEWQKKWESHQIKDSDIPEEQKKSLWRAWGYRNSSLGLKEWLGSEDELDLAHYYSLKILNDELNETREVAETTSKNVQEDLTKLSLKKADIENVRKNFSLIEENKKDINKNKEDINKNKEDINKNKEDINTNKELIHSYKKTIDSDITNNRRLVVANTAKNTAKITLNHQAIQKLTSELANLKTSLKRGLATQSALNGLFQPYSVGKFNLTAAFGGYQSQTAIAIGTGYRFNERIAAKAGIAKSVKGAALSYNVGVNYEF